MKNQKEILDLEKYQIKINLLVERIKEIGGLEC